jgi:hypothetical protein
LDAKLRHRINIVQFRLSRPAFLPFHLLAWGQQYARHRNCRAFYSNSAVEQLNDTTILPGKQNLGFVEGAVDETRVPKGVSDYMICMSGAVTAYTGGPVQVIYMRRPVDFLERLYHRNHSKNAASPRSGEEDLNRATPLRFIYYTECDQIVHFDSPATLLALSAASNETTFFTGRRKEKNKDSKASAYMTGLTMWRECGNGGYSLSWPQSHYVQVDK